MTQPTGTTTTSTGSGITFTIPGTVVPPAQPAPPAPVPTPPPAPVPTPPPAPPTPTNPPVPTPPTQGAQDGPNGFPENTPWRDMTSPQQAAYWQHQARKHEERVKAMSDYEQLKNTAAEYQKLVDAAATEQEKAIAEARRQGHAEAMTAAGGRLVEAWVIGAIGGRLDEERQSALLAGLNHQAFLTQTGDVDTARVSAFVNAFIPSQPAAQPPAPTDPQQNPAPVAGQPPMQPPAAVPPATPSAPQLPDFGQGTPPNAPLSELEAGRAAARARLAARQPMNTSPLPQ